MWEPGGKFSTACPLDVRYYPFDHQNCTVVFANWHYTKDQVNLSIAEHIIQMDAYETNAEWYVIGTSGHTDEFHANCCPEILYPEVIFTISMRRKYTYYIINILIPCAMMSLLILAVFFLPPDSGEKVSLGVTVLLAFSVFQLMIAESVPRSSGTTPILGKTRVSFFMVHYNLFVVCCIPLKSIPVNFIIHSMNLPTLNILSESMCISTGKSLLFYSGSNMLKVWTKKEVYLSCYVHISINFNFCLLFRGVPSLFHVSFYFFCDCIRVCAEPPPQNGVQTSADVGSQARFGMDGMVDVLRPSKVHCCGTN